MADASKTQAQVRDELLSLFSVSGTLAGLCITVVAFMNAINRGQSAVTIVDDVLAVCAAGFLTCIYLIFWALKTPNAKLASILIKVVDSLFLLTLTSMTIAAFIMIYTIW